MPDQGSCDGLKVDTTVDVRCHQCGWRQCPVRRVGDDPKCRERHPMLDRNPRRHMRFHIDRDRTGLFVKRSFRMSAGDGHIRSHNIAK